MSDLREDSALLRRLQLKVGINRYLTKRRGSYYLDQIRDSFCSYSDEEFSSIVDEMIADRLIVRTLGPRGGVILQQLTVTQQETTNG